ncbi:hypothetical protein LSAT2_001144, partial [Lamellibrachia satsuma]
DMHFMLQGLVLSRTCASRPPDGADVLDAGNRSVVKCQSRLRLDRRDVVTCGSTDVLPHSQRDLSVQR